MKAEAGTRDYLLQVPVSIPSCFILLNWSPIGECTKYTEDLKYKSYYNLLFYSCILAHYVVMVCCGLCCGVHRNWSNVELHVAMVNGSSKML